MLEKEVRVPIPPVEFIDRTGRVIGINGARFKQILAQQSPSNRFMRVALSDLGISTETPPQRQIAE
ncbi:hypothetical protein HYT74_02640 [Candidatus Daviesbacteria bacterium]|nr:hypothetical protein [Candidatus Daviesbacteria bacterium]